MISNKVGSGPMLNLYPDSIGGKLKDANVFLSNDKMKDVFESVYILPSVFNTDLDRGFSVIDYEINEVLASKEDIETIQKMDIDFKFDFILNHASVLSKQFQDILKNGEDSKYKDFFINWNTFWDGNGEMTEGGFIQPEEDLIKDMFFRKPGLPILMVRMPDGKEVPYWNTFYQDVKYAKLDTQDVMKALDVQYLTALKLSELVNTGLDAGQSVKDMAFGEFEAYKSDVLDLVESGRRYLGQMDLNVNSPLVWDFYEDTLSKLAGYGAKIVRLDAFAYASKIVGERNFFNEPQTWDILSRLNEMAKARHLTLLPEIHSKYEEGIHLKISENGYMTYDFFLPGLVIDAFERQTSEALIRWINDVLEKEIKTVNMLGCHDGIPLLDLKGLLKDDQIQNLIDTVVARGGHVKDLHGKKNIYYQVNATYYSALGEDDKKMLLARAIQMFMPGKPQIWYLDLFAGKNDHEALRRAGANGHKEINRTNLTIDDIQNKLDDDIVQRQIDLIRFRKNYPAFGFDAKLTVLPAANNQLQLKWEKDGHFALLKADLKNMAFEIETDGDFSYKSE